MREKDEYAAKEWTLKGIPHSSIIYSMTWVHIECSFRDLLHLEYENEKRKIPIACKSAVL